MIIHENTLTQVELKNILSQNKDKKLISLLILSRIKDNAIIGKIYFFIFEKSISSSFEKDFLILELKKKNTPEEIFFEDLAIKLNDFHNDENVRLILK